MRRSIWGKSLDRRSILTSYLGKSECTPTRAMPASPSLSCKKTILKKKIFKDSRKMIKTRPSVNHAKGWLDHWSVIPHSWSCCLVCVFGHFRHGDKQTANQVILVQDCSWPVRRQSCAKKEIYALHASLSLSCFCVTFEYVKGDFVTFDRKQSNFVTFEHLKASFVIWKCKKCDIVWNVTRATSSTNVAARKQGQTVDNLHNVIAAKKTKS